MTTRVALVTGAGSGMGEAISKRLADGGMTVGVLDINREAAARVSEDIRGAGGLALALQADVSKRVEVIDAVAQLRQAFGAISVLVNNAGIESFRSFEAISDDDWDRILNVNLKAAYIVTQTVLADMKAQGWGRIVNLSSMAAQTGAAGMVDYAASKGGITAMTRSLAVELGPLGITVNAISPGFIWTPMAQRSFEQGYFPGTPEDMVKHYPIPRAGQAGEVAAACAYFVSEDAGYTTGQLLGINGGTCM